jgi:hypothetical protein
VVNDMDKRVCIKCEITYPLEDKYFALAHKSGTRRVTVCRECRKEYDRQYREAKQEEEVGNGMYEIKEIPEQVQKRNLLKAFNYIHLQAFGEQMTEMIYWCKADDCVQISDDNCGKCEKTMEKIGFIDYNENEEKK